MGDPLGYLGLARRSGRLPVGETAVEKALRMGEAQLVCLAADLSPSSAKRIAGLAGQARTPCLTLPDSKERLGAALGRGVCGILAVTDLGLAAAFTACLAQKHPALYGEAAALLKQRQTGRNTRQKERSGAGSLPAPDTDRARTRPRRRRK